MSHRHLHVGSIQWIRAGDKGSRMPNDEQTLEKMILTKNAASSDLFLDFSVEIIIIARLWLEKSG